MPRLAGGKIKKGRSHNPGPLDAVALVVNPSDPPKKGKRRMARKKRKKRKKVTRRRATTSTPRRRAKAKRRRKRNPAPARRQRRRAAAPAKRRRRNAAPARRRKRNPYHSRATKRSPSRRSSRRRNPNGIGDLSLRNIGKLLPAIGWTALGWSLSGMIMAAMGQTRMDSIARWGFLKGNRGRARAVVAGLTWIGLWFAVDKVDYLSKNERKSNLLRGAGLRFAWELINGFVPTTGYGNTVRTVFGFTTGNQVIAGTTPGTMPGTTPPAAGASYTPGYNPSGSVQAGYDPYGGSGYGNQLDYTGYGGDPYGGYGGYGGDMLGMHYENWQAASPSGLALQPRGGSATAWPLGMHYENWQAASPSGLALQPRGDGAAFANPLRPGNANARAFRPAFRSAF